MTGRALVPAGYLSSMPCGAEADFEVSRLRVFSSIPEHNHGVVALRGMVAVYETDTISRADFVEDGGLYVIEHQYAPSSSSYAAWLMDEIADGERRSQPRRRLRTTREVVRLERHPILADCWQYRLASGYGDGPIRDWAACLPMVGKVVGIYRPAYNGGLS